MPGDEAESASIPVCIDGGPPPDLDAVDYAILGKWTERKTWAQMGRELDLTPQVIKARTQRPLFQSAVQRLQRNFFDQLSRGEYGALAIAKANAVGAMKRLVGLSRLSIDERVRLNANLEVIKLAGIQPPKPLVIESPERLLDQMTPEELDHFAATNEFPRRLADQLARVAATVLEVKTQATIEATWEPAQGSAGHGILSLHDPEPTPATELPDEDGPVWEKLPDETDLDEEGDETA